MDKKRLELTKYSNIGLAQVKAYEYLGVDAILFISPLKSKKFRIYDPYKQKYVDFGAMEYQDFTKHQDEERRQRYLKRATKIKGNWSENLYSPNNLSINILW